MGPPRITRWEYHKCKDWHLIGFTVTFTLAHSQDLTGINAKCVRPPDNCCKSCKDVSWFCNFMGSFQRQPEEFLNPH